MIQRSISKIILKDISKIPIIAILGPRQSGKTTLSKIIFPNHEYVTLEDFENREFALNDPKGFLERYSNGVIIDEAQYAPNLFSYLQVFVDECKENGKFVLTGSHNFGLLNSIRQSLAGRILIYTLLPLSLEELKTSKYIDANLDKHIFSGYYPRIYDQNLNPKDWLSSYIKTYIERDITDIINIKNIHQFLTFIKLCAARIGQLINYTSLGNEVGISDKTVKVWINLLETSYIIYTQTLL